MHNRNNFIFTNSHRLNRLMNYRFHNMVYFINILKSQFFNKL